MSRAVDLGKTIYFELILPAWEAACPEGPGLPWEAASAELVSRCRLEGLTLQDWGRLFLQGLIQWPGWPW
ncbi:MAG: hypothetical protein QN130_12405 [Armatimonadota bacterium]|nr:hypothetical protein [Armatimonadota bacterium]